MSDYVIGSGAVAGSEPAAPSKTVPEPVRAPNSDRPSRQPPDQLGKNPKAPPMTAANWQAPSAPSSRISGEAQAQASERASPLPREEMSTGPAPRCQTETPYPPMIGPSDFSLNPEPTPGEPASDPIPISTEASQDELKVIKLKPPPKQTVPRKLNSMAARAAEVLRESFRESLGAGSVGSAGSEEQKAHAIEIVDEELSSWKKKRGRPKKVTTPPESKEQAAEQEADPALPEDPSLMRKVLETRIKYLEKKNRQLNGQIKTLMVRLSESATTGVREGDLPQIDNEMAELYEYLPPVLQFLFPKNHPRILTILNIFVKCVQNQRYDKTSQEGFLVHKYVQVKAKKRICNICSAFLTGTSTKKHNTAFHNPPYSEASRKIMPYKFKSARYNRRMLTCPVVCGMESSDKMAILEHLVLRHSEREMILVGFSRNYCKFLLGQQVDTEDDLIFTKEEFNPLIKAIKLEGLVKKEKIEFGEIEIAQDGEGQDSWASNGIGSVKSDAIKKEVIDAGDAQIVSLDSDEEQGPPLASAGVDDEFTFCDLSGRLKKTTKQPEKPSAFSSNPTRAGVEQQSPEHEDFEDLPIEVDEEEEGTPDRLANPLSIIAEEQNDEEEEMEWSHLYKRKKV